MNSRVWKILFLSYIFLLLFFVVFKFNEPFVDRIISIQENRNQGYWNYNLTPFRSIKSYLRNINNDYALFNVLGNIVPFVPMGFFISGFTRLRRKYVTSVVCLGSILGIEALQFITMLGYFDVDDIILNFVGCLIGIIMYGLFRYIKIRALL